MTKKEIAVKKIEIPSKQNIDKYIEIFDKEQKRSENAVNAAFSSLDNSLVENIMVKVIVLNSRYSTRLSNNEPTREKIEEKIASNGSMMPNVVKVSEVISGFESDGRFDYCKDITDVAKLIKDFLNSFDKPYSKPYSFITKYCSFRLPDIDIPIVDNYVRALLIVINEKDGFYKGKISNTLLGDYDEFLKVINTFSEEYAKGYSAKDVDKYIWQYGKILFDDGFDIRNIL